MDKVIMKNSQAILPCNVTESNPPARHFNFFRNNQLLTDEKKYQQVMDVVENAAYLKVILVMACLGLGLTSTTIQKY